MTELTEEALQSKEYTGLYPGYRLLIPQEQKEMHGR